MLVLIWGYLSEVPEVAQEDMECIYTNVLIAKLSILMKKKMEINLLSDKVKY